MLVAHAARRRRDIEQDLVDAGRQPRHGLRPPRHGRRGRRVHGVAPVVRRLDARRVCVVEEREADARDARREGAGAEAQGLGRDGE